MTGETPGGLTESLREDLADNLFEALVGIFDHDENDGVREAEELRDATVAWLERLKLLAARAQPFGQDATAALDAIAQAVEIDPDDTCPYTYAIDGDPLLKARNDGIDAGAAWVMGIVRAALASDVAQQGGGV